MHRTWKPNTYPFVTSPKDSELGKRFSKDELIEDLKYMEKTFEEVHPNLYFNKSQETSSEQISKIKTELSNPLTRIEFYSRIAPYAADFNDGHTRVEIPHEEYVKSDEIGNVRFPFSLHCSKGEVTLTATVLEEYQGYVSRKLLSINGEPVPHILERMISMMSGETKDFRYSCLFMVFPKLLFVLNGGSESYSLKVSGDPSPEEITVPGLSRTQSITNSAGKAVNTTEPYSYEVLDESNCAVLTLLRCEDEEKFGEFSQDLFNVLKSKRIGNLLIDLRHNGGGSSAIGDELCAYLTNEPVYQYSGVEMKISEKVKKYYSGQYRDSARFPMNLLPLSILTLLSPPLRQKTGSIYKVSVPEMKPPVRNPKYEGKVYAVTSQFTYSAAASLAAMIKAHGLGKLIGAPTGGNESTYGDVFSFSLPNTKLTCGVSHKFFIGSDGARKPEPTYPDYCAKDLGIDLHGPNAIPEIVRNLDKF
jgi:hypothetical protein